jgi:hypothetical protein
VASSSSSSAGSSSSSSSSACNIGGLNDGNSVKCCLYVQPPVCYTYVTSSVCDDCPSEYNGLPLYDQQISDINLPCFDWESCARVSSSSSFVSSSSSAGSSSSSSSVVSCPGEGYGAWQLVLCDEEDCGYPVCSQVAPNGWGPVFSTYEQCRDCHSLRATCSFDHPKCWQNL